MKEGRRGKRRRACFSGLGRQPISTLVKGIVQFFTGCATAVLCISKAPSFAASNPIHQAIRTPPITSKQDHGRQCGRTQRFSPDRRIFRLRHNPVSRAGQTGSPMAFELRNRSRDGEVQDLQHQRGT